VPIRPENRALYGPEWDRLAARLKAERAGQRCECRGECGRPADGGTVGHLVEDGRCGKRAGQLYVSTSGRHVTVVLTVAHLDHDPEVWPPDEARLRVMCQGCHLHYDREHHRHSRAVATACAMEAAGQTRLPLTP
jgi:hypothetical protein